MSCFSWGSLLSSERKARETANSEAWASVMRAAAAGSSGDPAPSEPGLDDASSSSSDAVPAAAAADAPPAEDADAVPAAAALPLSAIEDGNANDISADAVAIPPAAGDLEAAHALSEPTPDFSVPDKRLGRNGLNTHILELMDSPLELQGAGGGLTLVEVKNTCTFMARSPWPEPRALTRAPGLGPRLRALLSFSQL